MAYQLDKELQEYKDMMEVPSQFDDGFTFSAFIGAIFIGLVMIPGSIYMGLVAGVGIGGAAQWVTVILFIEMAKRANATLKKAEIFILFYMAGCVMSAGSGFLWAQFFVRSEAATSFGLLGQFPEWYAPSNVAELPRSFFLKEWMPALGMMLFGSIIGRLDGTILGYGLFRIASDVEKLPFPMAPMGAQGMMTLAEDFDENEGHHASWRWRAFSIGGAIGMAFGFLYVGVPTLSGAFLSNTIQIFPIPFVDWTPHTARILPAVATGMAFDLGSLIVGMVLPFYAMVGSFAGLVITFILCPTLYHLRLLPSWREQMGTVETLFNNNIDFYFSFGIGLSLAIAIVGFISVIRSRSQAPEGTPEAAKQAVEIPPSRGDIPNWLFLLCYFASTIIYILVSGWLIDWHKGVMLVLLFFGFIYTPIISYVTARLEGIAGQVVEIPYIREISFILSGYQGLAIWFIPVPQANYGGSTVFYKTAELTGTSFRSIWKVDALLFPIILIAGIGFSNFIYTLGDIPSSAYPFTMEIWEFNAKNSALVFTSTLGYYSPFSEAFRISYVLIGTIIGLIGFGTCAFFNAPTTLCYGIVRGMGQTTPHSVLPQFIGALLSQFYFQKKFGKDWKKNIIVVSSGYMVGSGLISMLCVGIVFMSKSSSSLPY